ncbi:helix-turn-helix domain-containing protein [Geomonas oryzisoli]|uniref:Helix-turn-helix domain-containing protein n=1 Tax=Geomonas oryzisoli TaxID=2847992 RepID=A0ABX8J7A2_9BACT|nr:BsaWI family type II restriction enzyme [Geomonas oryzisoli]QWV94220.1 helix-turn-helix domain-containing protein [Geomonas oryzisoli]
MTTIYDSRYVIIVEQLKRVRVEKKVTQRTLAGLLGQQQSYVAKVEGGERRLDILELFDWLKALRADPLIFLREIGWVAQERPGNIPALPLPGHVEEVHGGLNLIMAWQGEKKIVFLQDAKPHDYLIVEKEITAIFQELNNHKSKTMNREAICKAFQLAFELLPAVNPSDVYHHIVYRLYLREYTKTNAEQSWVRAGGEAVELFVARHYADRLAANGIEIKALLSRGEKAAALAEMGLAGTVGDSKLDISLYGVIERKRYIFGGIHCKASFAERVSDDVPCSEAMMRSGLTSLLFTFDAKSFPPPAGDLINRGELGTHENPSDKRRYIEEHGSFDACFCYNLRSVPSKKKTTSGKRIYVCKFDEDDVLPQKVIEAWQQYKVKHKL